ncbi:hypothetical protein ABKN59_004185 [Abortiporus biennis]
MTITPPSSRKAIATENLVHPFRLWFQSVYSVSNDQIYIITQPSIPPSSIHRFPGRDVAFLQLLELAS